MRKLRSDSRLGSLPEEKQIALFERLEALPLEAGVTALAQEEGITLSRTSLAEWLKARRITRLGQRIRKYSATASQLERDAAKSPSADTAFSAAFREYTLDQIAAGNLSVADAARLNASLLAERRLSLDESALTRRTQLERERLDLRIRDLQARLEKQRFDAAKAVIAHAESLRQIVNDSSLDEPARMMRVQALLWSDPRKEDAP